MDNHPVQNLRVAIYARVSTEEQREGQTIDSQIAELERFATEKTWQLAGVYKDDGWSGSILARPELDHLRDDASKGLFGGVLINDVDRLARDVSHLGIVKRDLERHGVQVVFRKLPAEKSPTYNLMVNILGSFAEFEREMIADRTRRGRRHKVEVRQEYLGGNTAYGLRYIPKDKAAGKEGYLEVVPEEAAVVKQMFEWIDREGLSARQVVRRLSEMKVPPRKGGDGWGKSSVLRILRSETYAGVWHYNKYEGCEPASPAKTGKYRRSLKGSLRKRPRSEWLPVTLPDHLRLVGRDQWERVQKQLDQNITFSPRNTRHEYLLKGLVRCGGCGARYVGDPCHGKFYYRCHTRCKKVPTIKEEHLDNVVWSAIKEAVLNPSVIAEQLAKLYQKQTTNAEKVKTEVTEIAEALAQIQTEEERILEVYRKGILSAAQLGRELEQINIRKAALETRRASLSGQTDAPAFPAIRRSLMDYCKAVAQRMNKFTYEERQRFLRLLVNEIIFEGERVIIKGIIPIGTPKEVRQLQDRFSDKQADFSFKSGIAGTMMHHRALNSVEEIFFELRKRIERTKQSAHEAA